jgi:hypothetical protein
MHKAITAWLQRLKQEISEYLPLMWENMEELYATNKAMLLTPAVISMITCPKMLKNFS